MQRMPALGVLSRDVQPGVCARSQDPPTAGTARGADALGMETAAPAAPAGECLKRCRQKVRQRSREHCLRIDGHGAASEPDRVAAQLIDPTKGQYGTNG